MSQSMESSTLNHLSCRIEDLVALCEQLRSENRQLRADAQQWNQERAELINNNEATRIRVEAMIGRLNALEHDA